MRRKRTVLPTGGQELAPEAKGRFRLYRIGPLPPSFIELGSSVQARWLHLR